MFTLKYLVFPKKTLRKTLGLSSYSSFYRLTTVYLPYVAHDVTCHWFLGLLNIINFCLPERLLCLVAASNQPSQNQNKNQQQNLRNATITAFIEKYARVYH
ncbi:Hypothetical predicted protein [Marmota monax]|uniref:Uncharacterized protein n=1 Tax=Marmota monax TaxID=9995 RepID=A0A5E4D083_MARMO|nr:hypothetical protein GHT09_015670 [Marmota monax]VTJ87483.1 Hypothetical predicted protein [Marmota monax]